MKKQILYPKFIPRLFSITIDLFLITIILPFIMSIFAKIIYGYAFNDYILIAQSAAQGPINVAQIFYSPVFFDYISTAHKTGIYFICIVVLNLINFLLMGTYFVTFWKYFGATPGKLVMGMRIVDADTLEKPTTYQFIKRFCGYLTAIFGMWSILFTARGQALHDKISSTVVIKS